MVHFNIYSKYIHQPPCDGQTFPPRCPLSPGASGSWHGPSPTSSNTRPMARYRGSARPPEAHDLLGRSGPPRAKCGTPHPSADLAVSGVKATNKLYQAEDTKETCNINYSGFRGSDGTCTPRCPWIGVQWGPHSF